jgi:polyisoprenoid-binding protein YceI
MISKTKWTIDQAHSEIGFKVRHLMIAHVKGSFKTFDASIYTTGKDFKTAEIDVWIDASSISTREEKRDEHLKSADFFDVEKYKQITFTSTSMEDLDEDGKAELWGELTMVGVTRNIKLAIEFGGIATDASGREIAGFAISGKIKRSDWGLVWNTAIETGGLLVGDEVTLSCELELCNSGQPNLVIELETLTDGKAAT